MSPLPPQYSLWLVPSQSATFRDIIHKYSQKLGTPEWGPHLTLLGNIDVALPREKVIEAVNQIAQDVKAFKLTLSKIVTSSAFYRCIVATPEPSEPLEFMGAKARQLFSMPKPFWPHLSLVYGDLAEDVREVNADELRESGILGMTIDITAVEVWDCTGLPENWQFIARVQLAV